MYQLISLKLQIKDKFLVKVKIGINVKSLLSSQTEIIDSSKSLLIRKSKIIQTIEYIHFI
jgi:hypothetical protein